MTAMIAAAALCGCHQSKTAVPNQLAASFGTDEVTLYEVDRAMARGVARPDDDQARARRQILETLVDQHLLAGEAVAHKLDRTPDVVADVEACRLSTLRDAYVTSVADQLGANVESERRDAREYFDAHPELFAERKLFRMKEIAFPAASGIAPGQAQALRPDDLIAQLEKLMSSYRSTYAETAAENLPPEVLKVVSALDDGHSTTLQIGDNVLLVERVSARPAPLTFEEAQPRIMAFLQMRGVDAQIRTRVADLRAKDGVRYLNEFDHPTAAAFTAPADAAPGSSANGVIAATHLAAGADDKQ